MVGGARRRLALAKPHGNSYLGAFPNSMTQW